MENLKISSCFCTESLILKELEIVLFSGLTDNKTHSGVFLSCTILGTHTFQIEFCDAAFWKQLCSNWEFQVVCKLLSLPIA